MSNSQNPSTMPGLKTRLEEDPEMLEKMKKDPIAVLDQIARDAIPDTRVYRIVVGALGLGLLVTLVAAGIIVLVSLIGDNPNPDYKLPSIFSNIATGIIGALAGLLGVQR